MDLLQLVLQGLMLSTEPKKLLRIHEFYIPIRVRDAAIARLQQLLDLAFLGEDLLESRDVLEVG